MDTSNSLLKRELFSAFSILKPNYSTSIFKNSKTARPVAYGFYELTNYKPETKRLVGNNGKCVWYLYHDLQSLWCILCIANSEMIMCTVHSAMNMLFAVYMMLPSSTSTAQYIKASRRASITLLSIIQWQKFHVRIWLTTKH